MASRWCLKEGSNLLRNYSNSIKPFINFNRSFFLSSSHAFFQLNKYSKNTIESNYTFSNSSNLKSPYSHQFRYSSMCMQSEIQGSVPSQCQREVLPTSFKPLNYKIQLEPNFENFEFEGEETITLKVNEKSNVIKLNCFEIKINEVHVKDVKPVKTEFNDEDQTVSFTFSDSFEVGSTVPLYIRFSGTLNDKMVGFYRSTYEEDGETKYLATTQMEPVDCRRAFPCFDEPALKATFEVSLIADKKMTCLSNMDEKETKLLDGDKKLVSFNQTPLMSTYLVAFVVGELKYIENTSYRVPIRVYATPGLEHQGAYAAEITAKTLEFFDKKFDIPYPLPKCDLVAIHDFSAGAMENFGLITFRVIELLIDPKVANANRKQRVTEVVMHELAHQWFGNLVTMDFWDGLWLNEGFATWMSWYACDSLFPEWKVWESYVYSTLQGALSLDALRSSHPIDVPIKKASEINQIFDSISYNKGSSILKMISKWLGEEVFIKGVSNYLKKYKYGNTQTIDLWKSLSEVSGKDVIKVMDVWTNNMGFPVISIKELPENKLEITQHRFLATGDVQEEDDKVLFPVFLGLKTSSGVDEELALYERSAIIELKNSDDFFKFNADHSGVYRTSYEPERWTKLGKAAIEGKLSVEDRIGLVADASSLASAGHISTTNVMDMIRSWNDEDNYAVWDQIYSTIASISYVLLFENEDVIRQFKNFHHSIISPKLKEIGFTFNSDDTFAQEQLKTGLFATAVTARDPEILKFCKESFEKYAAGDKDAINAKIRGSVFVGVAVKGDQKVYDQLLSILKETNSAEETREVISALGVFNDPLILDQVMGLLMDPKYIRAQDIFRPLMTLRSHKNGIEKLWNWLTTNWDEISKYLPSESTLLGAVVMLATSRFNTLEKKKEVEEFFADKNKDGYDQILVQSLDSISANIAWYERDAKNIMDWLSRLEYKK